MQNGAYEQFVEGFTAAAKAVRVGNGMEKGVQMGPLANPRRITAMEGMIADAVQKGAEVRTGGKRIGNVGNFFEPTVMTGVNTEMRVMNEEPFGPLAVIAPFGELEEVVEGGEPAAVRAGELCVHAVGEDGGNDRVAGRGGDDDDQPYRAGAAGGAVRRGEGERARVRGGRGGD